MELGLIAVAAVVSFAIFFFVLKRLLRMAIRLALFGAIVVALAVGAFAWWWYSPIDNLTDQNQNKATRRNR